ncbi:MAG: PIN domain-containing protein [Methanobrevibacter thaueri]|nr:PIN domain-containing protein [Methanobrevibacter thaueri]
MRKIFIDSSYLIAIALDNDSNKEKALELSELLSEECYISDKVINEVVTVVNSRGNYTQAVTVYHYMVDNFKIVNDYEVANYNEKIIQIFAKYEGNLSFTDSAIIVLMLELGIDDLLSFDHGFKREGRINVIGI